MRWSGKGYNLEGKKVFEIKDGIGKGKVYDEEGNLIYKGEYINGKIWKGKVKEYAYEDYQAKIKFDGEYTNGEKTGKGKEYDKNGKLIYEGEFRKGVRNGKGKEFDNYNGELLFEGEYLNGKRWNGIGKEYNKYSFKGKQLGFEGEYLNDQRWNGMEKE